MSDCTQTKTNNQISYFDLRCGHRVYHLCTFPLIFATLSATNKWTSIAQILRPTLKNSSSSDATFNMQKFRGTAELSSRTNRLIVLKSELLNNFYYATEIIMQMQNKIVITQSSQGKTVVTFILTTKTML